MSEKQIIEKILSLEKEISKVAIEVIEINGFLNNDLVEVATQGVNEAIEEAIEKEVRNLKYMIEDLEEENTDLERRIALLEA